MDQIANSPREPARTKEFGRATSSSSATPGRPGMTFRSTVKLVRDTRPDDIGVSVSYPLPGTKFFERVRAQIRGKDQLV